MRLSAEERASISKVDSWIASGGGLPPVALPTTDLPHSAFSPSKARRWAASDKTTKPRPLQETIQNSLLETMKGDIVVLVSPSVPAVPSSLVKSSLTCESATEVEELECDAPTAFQVWMQQAPPDTTTTLDASSVVDGFFDGITALLQGAGTEAAKGIVFQANQAICGPTKCIASSDTTQTPTKSKPRGMPLSSAKKRPPLTNAGLAGSGRLASSKRTGSAAEHVADTHFKAMQASAIKIRRLSNAF